MAVNKERDIEEIKREIALNRAEARLLALKIKLIILERPIGLKIKTRLTK